MLVKLSTVEHSIRIRAGLSARAQIMAELAATSPDCIPDISGRSAARLR
jgi:hypothetical protein